MPITIKRKAQSPDYSKQTISTASQKSISQYGRVTKSLKVDQGAKRNKNVLEEALKIVSTGNSVRERPLRDQTGSSPSDLSKSTVEEHDEVPMETSRPSRKRKNEEIVDTPQHKRFKNAIPPTPAETPSKAAVHLFDKLSIETGALKDSASASASYDTPPLTPRSLGDLSEAQFIEQLPSSLQDIFRLFSAFLTSTSLYYAHNGSGSPLQLSFVLQNVTKAWKRRAVTDIDIRRLLGVLGKCNFEVVDNGDGMICLEQIETSSAGHFNQPALKEQFKKNLCNLWRNWTTLSATGKHEVAAFLSQLPLAEIHEGDLAPVKAVGSVKGQQRLEDLRKSAAQARSVESALHKQAVAAEAKTSAGVSSRGSNLLDRILAKQHALASQANGPTQDEIDRKTALNRIEDIIPVLDVLAGSRPRVSFSTLTLVSNLQNSLRNPISKEEAERCLELMASEVTPGFVSMIKSGLVKGVVITRSGRPSNPQLKLTLERAGA